METGAEVAPANGSKRKHYGPTRVSNGHDVLPGVDGRSKIARRYYDISTAIFVDQGGEDQCSESRKQLIRRFAAAAAVLAEQMEADLANGVPINIAEHATLSSTLVRLASRIGINRVPRDVTTLGQLIAEDQEAERQRLAQRRESEPVP
jgi:hypothetical protein